MHRHLIPVEIRVKSGTYKGVKLDRLTFYQHRLERLNTQSVQGRRTVQHNGMVRDNLLQHIPHLHVKTLHHLLCALDILRDLLGYQLLHNEGLEQFDRHLLRQAALVNLQFRPDHDNGTSGIVHTFS